MRQMRDRLAECGIETRSGWLDENAGQEFSMLRGEQMREYSHRDLGEIMSVDTIIIDTIEASPSGGREVELGAAIALGKRVIRIGPPRNIFHAVAHDVYSNWEMFFAYRARYATSWRPGYAAR